MPARDRHTGLQGEKLWFDTEASQLPKPFQLDYTQCSRKTELKNRKVSMEFKPGRECGNV